MRFVVEIDQRAIKDIQKAIDYYDEQQIGLGQKFENYINKYFKILAKNPLFQIRYDNIRCLPLRKFPFMIHFSVDEESQKVLVYAIINTNLDPKTYWVK